MRRAADGQPPPQASGDVPTAYPLTGHSPARVVRLKRCSPVAVSLSHLVTLVKPPTSLADEVSGFLLDVCEIIANNLLPTEESGEAHFRDFLRDEIAMRRLFQEFIRNFYRREQRTYSVGSRILHWHGVSVDAASDGFLPQMRTDITLTSPRRSIVLETKYYQDALEVHHGKGLVRSDHLYQVFAYLRNAQACNPIDLPWEGILLYPTVAEDLDLRFCFSGHPVRVATINLNQDWRLIHRNLLRLVQTECFAALN